MNNKRILTGIAMICVSTLIISCSSSKKSGCYYGDESVKEFPIEKKVNTKAYTIAE